MYFINLYQKFERFKLGLLEFFSKLNCFSKDMLINISHGYSIHNSKFSSLFVKFIIIFVLMLNFLEIICLKNEKPKEIICLLMPKHGEIETVVCVVFKVYHFRCFHYSISNRQMIH